MYRIKKTDYMYMVHRIVVILLSGFIFFSCKTNTAIPECNPEDGRFVNGRHYVSGSMLTEDQNWDHIPIQKYFDRRARLYPDTSCIPVEAEASFEELLQDKTEAIDLKGR